MEKNETYDHVLVWGVHGVDNGDLEIKNNIDEIKTQLLVGLAFC